MNQTPTLSDTEFSEIASFVYENFGIHLSTQKKILVAGRLSKRVRQLGLSSFSSYLNTVREDGTGGELSELINRITTNHSYFFRETDHFDFLSREVFPNLNKNDPVRIWSAGCAAGEEVYTISMLLQEFFGPSLPEIDLGILATDVSLAALETAREGIYPANRTQGTPAKYLSAHFRKIGQEHYALSEDIKRMVLFKKLNLMDAEYPFKSKFDFIFCRNVMIYFNEETRKRLVETLYRYTKPGGYLFIGHSESLRRDSCPYRYVQPAVYRKIAVESNE